VEYRRPGERRGLATAWRILQAAALALVVVGFYKTARNFNRPVQPVSQAALTEQAQLFFQYAAAMDQARKKADAVIQNRDVTNINEIAQRAAEAPVLNARAVEFRDRLLSILTRALTAASEPTPPAGDGPRRLPPLNDEKLIADFQQWQSEYDQWMHQALQTFSTVQAK
jgi:hypothetical protein